MSMIINPFMFAPPAAGNTLTAELGAFALTGNPVAFKRSLRMSAAPGAFGITGKDANLNTGNAPLVAATGTFAFTGNDVSFKRSLRMSAAAGVFSLTGNAATLTSSGSDPNFSSVVLLCGFNGVDGATTATDDSNSAKTLTFFANAQIDTAQSKFGGASLLLDGNGDYLEVASSADWSFGSSPVTIEFFVRFNALSSSQRMMIGNGGASGNLGWGAGVTSDLAAFQFFYSSNSGTSYNNTVTTSGVTPATGQWYHFCVEVDGSNKLRVYVDGVMRGSLTSAPAINYETTSLYIGSYIPANITASEMNGWIDELRITKGVARYASDSGFTVPTAAFPRS
ncbi:LamG domain-containing protein [Ensifer sp. B1-9]|uniref:LamG domain-containing protein n=1 Tax=Ensifer sp. B1-9 TaxID=3141455 RepID=UPI003D20587D